MKNFIIIVRQAAAIAALAGLAAAGVLVNASPALAGSAQAGPGRWAGNVMAEAGSAMAQAARKPLRAERRTDIADIACEASIDYPDGDETIAVTYYNCSDTTLVLALTATTSDDSGTVTYTSVCQQFLPGEAWFWTITPDLSAARRPTFIYRVSECG